MRIILLVVLAFIASCSGPSSFNQTAFEYTYDQEKLDGKAIKKVVLATAGLSTPPPSYLANGDRKTRAMVKEFLISNGYTILPDYHFENAWKQANRTYGDIFDPTTGAVDMQAWRGAMATTGKLLREQTEADLIIFSDLFVHDVQHSTSSQHLARWYGVTRKPTFVGSATGIPVGFDWAQSIKGASLMITIFDIDLNRVFASRGGIDTLYSLNVKKSTPRFVRKKKMLKTDDHIEEGIDLAFHPFIPMKKYPGNARDVN